MSGINHGFVALGQSIAGPVSAALKGVSQAMASTMGYHSARQAGKDAILKAILEQWAEEDREG